VFGINGGELLVLLLVAAVVVGPERLPRYAEQLARWVRSWRATLMTARERLADELGEQDVDWTALDPRRYDPRRIVREALADPAPTRPGGAPGRPYGGAAGSLAGGPGAAWGGARPGAAGTPGDGPAPFDDEAT
jgi:sec-independent protein translocase protein TatB